MSRARIWLAALILIAGSAWLANQGVNHPSPETDTAHRRPRPTSMTGAEHRDLAGERQEFKQQRQEYFDRAGEPPRAGGAAHGRAAAAGG
jgi:hypothetical protein